MNFQIIKRGDVFYADLPVSEDSVQGGRRPVVVLSNDIGNAVSPVFICVPMTTKIKRSLPTHVKINKGEQLLDSTVLCEQILTVGKERLGKHMMHLPDSTMRSIENAVHVSLGMAV